MWRLRNRLFWVLVWHMVGCAPCRFNRNPCRMGSGMSLDLYSQRADRKWKRRRRELSPFQAGFLSAFDPTGRFLADYFRRNPPRGKP